MTINLNIPGSTPMLFESSIPNNAFANSSKAVMFIMKVKNGKQFSDTPLRSFHYNFDTNFREETLDVLESMREVTFNHRSLLDQMKNRINLSDCIVPSMVPQISVKTSRLNDVYRFVLVFTTKPQNDLISGNTFLHSTSGVEYRRIYNGFFLDESFNPLTGTPNPNAVIVITHKTVLNSHTDFGPYGANTMINAMASESVHNADISKEISVNLTNNQIDNSLFLTTPENVVNSSTNISDGFGFSNPGGIIDSGAVKFKDFLEQPAHHASVIVKGFITDNETTMQRAHLSTHRSQSMIDDFFGNEMGNSRRSHHFAIAPEPRQSPFDLDENSKITLGHLDQMVSGDLEIIRLFIENPMYYDTVDQMERSVTNMYSSLIATVVPPVLNSAGIRSFGFEYQVKRTAMFPEENFMVHHVDMAWTVPQDQQVAKIRAIQHELSTGIFKTIFESQGDFTVLVHADVTGMTKVRLSLVGAGYKCLADFEHPSCLGGIVSPLIANSLVSTTNAEAMDNLFVHTQNSISMRRHKPEDRDFMSYAADKFAGYEENIIVD